MIKAQIVGDSLSPQGHRLTSFLVTFPRIILAEKNTHRMLTKNSASSRAIPFKKMVEIIKTNPFIPIAWQKDHKGMQGTEYILPAQSEHDHNTTEDAISWWLEARDSAVHYATMLHNMGVTKQLCNRLLEPFMWHTVLVTGEETGFENFFNLRSPQYEDEAGAVFRSKKDFYNHSQMPTENWIEDFDNQEWFSVNKGQAEIHMMALAEAMWDAYNESTPKDLREGDWHIPFGDKITDDYLDEVFGISDGLRQKISVTNDEEQEKFWSIQDFTLNHYRVKIATAMAARVSYTTVGEEKEVSYEKLIELHDRLINQDPLHASPMEHCAIAMSDKEYSKFIRTDKGYPTEGSTGFEPEYGWCRNFRGFVQYRHILENGA